VVRQRGEHDLAAARAAIPQAIEYAFRSGPAGGHDAGDHEAGGDVLATDPEPAAPAAPHPDVVGEVAS
jgi:hypothetical protein